MVRRLEREDCEVVTAEDGLSALNIIKSFTPDIIFVDLIMPKIDGTELCRIIRADHQLENCFLAVVSAAISESNFNCDEIDADAFIAKESYGEMAKNFIKVIKGIDHPDTSLEVKKTLGIDNIHGRQITKELLSHNRHLETILENTYEGILEIFAKKIVYVNTTAISLFGVPKEKKFFL